MPIDAITRRQVGVRAIQLGVATGLGFLVGQGQQPETATNAPVETIANDPVLFASFPDIGFLPVAEKGALNTQTPVTWANCTNEAHFNPNVAQSLYEQINIIGQQEEPFTMQFTFQGKLEVLEFKVEPRDSYPNLVVLVPDNIVAYDEDKKPQHANIWIDASEENHVQNTMIRVPQLVRSSHDGDPYTSVGSWITYLLATAVCLQRLTVTSNNPTLNNGVAAGFMSQSIGHALACRAL